MKHSSYSSSSSLNYIITYSCIHPLHPPHLLTSSLPPILILILIMYMYLTSISSPHPLYPPGSHLFIFLTSSSPHLIHTSSPHAYLLVLLILIFIMHLTSIFLSSYSSLLPLSLYSLHLLTMSSKLGCDDFICNIVYSLMS